MTGNNFLLPYLPHTQYEEFKREFQRKCTCDFIELPGFPPGSSRKGEAQKVFIIQTHSLIIVDNNPIAASILLDKIPDAAQLSPRYRLAIFDFNGYQAEFSFKNQVNLGSPACSIVVIRIGSPQALKPRKISSMTMASQDCPITGWARRSSRPCR